MAEGEKPRAIRHPFLISAFFTLKTVYVYYLPAFLNQLNKGFAYEKRTPSYSCSYGRHDPSRDGAIRPVR
jgi:hypothetical protein